MYLCTNEFEEDAGYASNHVILSNPGCVVEFMWNLRFSVLHNRARQSSSTATIHSFCREETVSQMFPFDSNIFQWVHGKEQSKVHIYITLERMTCQGCTNHFAHDILLESEIKPRRNASETQQNATDIHPNWEDHIHFHAVNQKLISIDSTIKWNGRFWPQTVWWTGTPSIHCMKNRSCGFKKSRSTMICNRKAFAFFVFHMVQTTLNPRRHTSGFMHCSAHTTPKRNKKEQNEQHSSRSLSQHHPYTTVFAETVHQWSCHPRTVRMATWTIQSNFSNLLPWVRLRAPNRFSKLKDTILQFNTIYAPSPKAGSWQRVFFCRPGDCKGESEKNCGIFFLRSIGRVRFNTNHVNTCEYNIKC